MKYCLLGARCCRELNDKIKDALERGWVLYGSPFSDKHSLYQAVILKEKPE